MKKAGILLSVCLLLMLVTACSVPQNARDSDNQTITVTDMVDRQVKVPRNIQRFSCQNSQVAAYIVYALGQQDKLVAPVPLGKLGRTMAKTDDKKSIGNGIERVHSVNVEQLLMLKPQVVFCQVDLDGTALQQLVDSGFTVVAIKGETLEDGFEAVRLIAKILDCEDKGKEYTNACEKLLQMVESRVGDVPVENRPRALVERGAGNFAVASDDMSETLILRRAGAENVAAGLRAFWPVVSPERIIEWNPDAIFLGRLAGEDDTKRFLDNTIFSTLKAIANKQVYVFPSNIGCWDFPAPHCVLGIVWTAKTLYPDRFADVNMTEIADDFYKRFIGTSFTELGGKL